MYKGTFLLKAQLYDGSVTLCVTRHSYSKAGILRTTGVG